MIMVVRCCCLAGVVDTVVMSYCGMDGKAVGHGVGTVVLGGVAVGLGRG